MTLGVALPLGLGSAVFFTLGLLIGIDRAWQRAARRPTPTVAPGDCAAWIAITHSGEGYQAQTHGDDTDAFEMANRIIDVYQHFERSRAVIVAYAKRAQHRHLH